MLQILRNNTAGGLPISLQVCVELVFPVSYISLWLSSESDALKWENYSQMTKINKTFDLCKNMFSFDDYGQWLVEDSSSVSSKGQGKWVLLHFYQGFLNTWTSPVFRSSSQFPKQGASATNQKATLSLVHVAAAGKYGQMLNYKHMWESI